MANNKYLEEIDDELGLEEETPEEQAPMRSQFLSEANDDAQLEYTPEEPLTETELQPSAQERYANVLKQAAAAGPRASDYRAAALSRMFSGIGASTPGYLSKMSQTLYHKPDFSWLGAGQKDLAAIGDYDIKAKEAEKKRLVDKAAGIRQEALLPGEIAAQEAKSQEAQARLEALKPASKEQLDEYENLTGTRLPANTTRAALAKFMERALTPMTPYEKEKVRHAEVKTELIKTGQGVSKSEQPVSDTYRKMVAKELSRIMEEDVDLTGMSSNEIRDFASLAKHGRITPEQKARIKAAIERNDLRQKELKDKKEREELALLVPGIGRALTPDDSKKLKPLAAAQNRLVAGIDDIAKGYGKLKAESVLKSPILIQQIGVQGKDLVMQFKELYGLGAPQQAELKFLYSLADSTPKDIIETLLSDRYAGTSIEQKLNKLKEIVKRNVQEEAKVRLRPEEGAETSPTPTQPQQPDGGDQVRVEKISTGRTGSMSKAAFEQDQKSGNPKYRLIKE